MCTGRLLALQHHFLHARAHTYYIDTVRGQGYALCITVGATAVTQESRSIVDGYCLTLGYAIHHYITLSGIYTQCALTVGCYVIDVGAYRSIGNPRGTYKDVCDECGIANSTCLSVIIPTSCCVCHGVGTVLDKLT